MLDQRGQLSRVRGFACGVPMRLVGLVVALALNLALAPLAGEAQQAGKMPRIGVLSGPLSANLARIKAFREGLGELGYVEGKSIVIEWRFLEDKGDRLPALAVELTRLKVDVLVAFGPASTQAAKEATNTIPIVMAQVNDPIGALGLTIPQSVLLQATEIISDRVQ